MLSREGVRGYGVAEGGIGVRPLRAASSPGISRGVLSRPAAMLKLPVLRALLSLCGAWLLAEANPDAKRLYDDLLSNYNRLIRPVSNNTDTVLVKLGLRLSQLIDLVSVLVFLFSLQKLVTSCK